MNRILRFLIDITIKQQKKFNIKLVLGTIVSLLIIEYVSMNYFGASFLMSNLMDIIIIFGLLFLSWFYIYCAHVLPKEDIKKYELLIEPIKTDKRYNLTSPS